MKNMLKKSSLLSYVFSSLMLVVCASPVLALSEAQKQLFDQGVYYYDISAASSCSTAAYAGAALPASVPQQYNSLLTQAAKDNNTNVQLLAAVFLSENANVWKPFNSDWTPSPKGASGPFQIMPATWDSYKSDGNNDGVKDINNIYDAAYTAAKILNGDNARPNSELGDINTPFKTNTLLQISASYNWGGGNVQMHTTPTSSISGDGKVPTETQNYIKNVYSLITSGFTKSGVSGWTNPSADSSNAASSGVIAGNCSGGVVAGSVAQTAVNLSWPGPHTPPLDPTTAYDSAVQKYNPTGYSSSKGADCGAFVATVMIASGADTNYPGINTGRQQEYVESHPEKYTVLQDIQSTADLQPGDILIVNTGNGTGADGHTMIWVGTQKESDGSQYNEASASQGTRMPSLGWINSLSDNRGHYIVARLK